MPREMLINTVQGQECRIAVVSENGLEEYYVERTSRASRVGNIYKGRVTNVESAIQAAFVDFGLPKNGFLHISDVNPHYFPKGHQGTEQVGRKRPHRERPPIQECLRRGQEVIVQMTKEGIGTKGPTLTSYLSIPGRLVVMMPGMSRLGVSRKIEDEDARAKARALLSGLKLPDNMGFIIRTAGLDRSKRDLQRDLNYLLRLWKSVEQRIKTTKAPAEIYQESDLVIRTLRDVYDTDIERIICDSPAVARRVGEFLVVAMPRTKHRVNVYNGKEGLFHDFGLETEIEGIYARRVEMPSGGSLVIDQTEALVAIDVNSGRFRDHSDAETTATKMNIQAAKEIGRQLRLRDLGGVVIIDFIDMREEKSRRAVERAFHDAIAPDRAKTKVLRVSRLGIVEMTRQRVGPSLESNYYSLCPHCRGNGMIKSEESQALQVLRYLQRATAGEDVLQVEVAVTPDVAHHLSNHQRRRITRMEAASGVSVVIRADPSLAGDDIKITCRNSRGSVTPWEPEAAPGRRKKEISTVPLDLAPPESQEPEEPDELDLELEEEEEEEPAAPGAEPGQPAAQPAPEQAKPAPQAPGPEQTSQRKGRRRGRRGGRKHKKYAGEQAPGTAQPSAPAGQAKPAEPAAKPAPQGQKAPEQPRPTPAPQAPAGAEPPRPDQPPAQQAKEPAPAGQPAEAPKPHHKSRRGRHRRKKATQPQGQAAEGSPPPAPPQGGPQHPAPSQGAKPAAPAGPAEPPQEPARAESVPQAAEAEAPAPKPPEGEPPSAKPVEPEPSGAKPAEVESAGKKPDDDKAPSGEPQAGEPSPKDAPPKPKRRRRRPRKKADAQPDSPLFAEQGEPLDTQD